MISKKSKERLRAIVDSRLGRGASEKYPLEFPWIIHGPVTDFRKIYIPSYFPYLYGQKILIFVTRHEADHIKEAIKLSQEIAKSEGPEEGEKYIERFFLNEKFQENPSLAFWIFNLVEDNRIDAAARKELPGIRKIFEEIKTDLLKRRPPISKMSNDVDKFRELLLQYGNLGLTKEDVPEKWQSLLDECVDFLKEAEGSKTMLSSLASTEKIYLKLKENFDIKQKMMRIPSFIPPLFKRKSPSPSNPSRGIQKSDVRKKPKEGAKGKKPPESGEQTKDGSSLGKSPEEWLDEEREILIPSILKLEKTGQVGKLVSQYTSEIEKMVKIFRLLKKARTTPYSDWEGEELDIEEYVQAELEKEATGISSDASVFIEDRRDKPKPGWMILVDISGSTGSPQHNILDELKATIIILGEALKRSDYHFGLFAFNSPNEERDNIYILKNLDEKYNKTSLERIMSLRSDDSTGMADSIVYLSNVLKKISCHPKGIIIVTDGEPTRLPPVEEALKRAEEAGIICCFCIIGEHTPPMIQKSLVKEYIKIGKNEINKLPGETLRLFRKYRLVR